MTPFSPNLQQFEDVSLALEAEAGLYRALLSGDTDFGGFAWSGNRSLVVPKKFSDMTGFEDASEMSAESGWPVHIRPTGGGTSPQGTGIINVCFGFRVPGTEKMSIQETYLFICNPILRQMKDLGVNGYCDSIEGSFCDGAFNVAADGKKIVGTAQRWGQTIYKQDESAQKKRVAFAHAVILYAANLPQLVNAINQFHTKIGCDIEVRTDAQTNLSDIGPFGKSVEAVSEFVNRLMNSYQDAWKKVQLIQ